jgi:extracellular elastinolytic metalloproteinase
MLHTMQRSLIAVACAAALALSTNVLAQAAPGQAARVLHAPPGQALTSPSAAAPAAIIAGLVRSRGGPDLTTALTTHSDGPGASGLRHVRLQQTVDGVPVHGATLKATLNARGEVLHLIDRSVEPGAGAPRAARIDERQALAAAMARVHPGVSARFGAGVRDGAVQRFAGGAFFHSDPEVSRVLLPQIGGGLAEGFLVQTWTQRQNLLDHTVVDGNGLVVSVERRTANDSYNVFTVDPGKGPQAVVQGPGAGNAQSPSGWLSGTQTTYAINGNNVSAYLDADANNRADRGGTSVSSGNFLAAANLAQAPTTTTNKAVAVQNLFYLNNTIHDILYRHGFNEAAGNFQTNNFSKGGRGSDPVNAEAQDGSGTDNANFATPSDGQRPRMQMYLWSGAGPTHELVLSGGPTYGAKGSSFGSQLTTTGISFPVVAGLDNVGTSTDGCEALPSAQVTGKIVLVDRGTCSFTVKVKNAQVAGARGVIIANNDATAIFAPGGTDSTVTIPSMMISQADGTALRARLGTTGAMRKKAVQPLQIDASLDSDVVYHEYGHGLTWRMIGGMSGPLAGAIGEGASDVVAFMVNGDDVVGEYSSSSPTGIRSARYAGYGRTYANVAGTGVHFDGEVYAATMWRLRELWLASGRPADSLFGHFVDGMNYTPSTPAFEDMRSGMLAAIANTAGADATARCALVWQAFAQYGIGVGAKGTVLTSTSVSITPSNVARSDCTP